MAMPEAGRIWTREEVLALPDDENRYELIAGQLLVSPSPRPVHQLAPGRSRPCDSTARLRAAIEETDSTDRDRRYY